MRIIDVQPFAHGWTVRSEQIDNNLVFRSGRAAEQAAVGLADRLAKAGIPPEICVHLKDGTLGGRFLIPALESANGRPGATAPDPSWALDPALGTGLNALVRLQGARAAPHEALTPSPSSTPPLRTASRSPRRAPARRRSRAASGPRWRPDLERVRTVKPRAYAGRLSSHESQPAALPWPASSPSGPVRTG